MVRNHIGICFVVGMFLAASSASAATTYFDLNFGGLDLYNETNAPAYAFTQFLFTNVTGQAGSSLLQLTFQQDPAYYSLDDVVVVPASSDTGIYSPCDTVAGNLVLNCGFESGDFTSWTQFGNTGFTGVAVQSPFNVLPNSGSYLAYFGPVGSTGGISQSIPTSAGTLYDISIYLENDGGGSPVPEPATMGLTLSGLGLFGSILRRRRS